SEAAAGTLDAPVAPSALRGDVDAIISKCLRTDPGQRYQTVDALRLDLERSRAGGGAGARGRRRLYIVAGVLAIASVATFATKALKRQDDSAGPYATSNPVVHSEYVLGHRFLARESKDGMRRAAEA